METLTFTEQNGIISIWSLIQFALGSTLLFFYVLKKCPCLIRVLGILCLVSLLSKLFPDFSKYNSWSENLLKPYISNLLYFLYMKVKNNSQILYSTFFIMCIVRLWWCDKLYNLQILSKCDYQDDGNSNEVVRLQSSSENEDLNHKETSLYPPFYPNGWLAILNFNKLTKRQIKMARALGRTFYVYRGDSGQAFVFETDCCYLEESVMDNSVVENDCLTCMVHQWKYDSQSGPSSTAENPKVNEEKFHTKTITWTSAEVNSVIYVWHHAEGLLPDWHVPVEDDMLKGPLRCKGEIELTFDSHFQDIYENAVDFGHFNALHTGSTHSEKLIEGIDKKWDIIRSSYDVNFEASPHGTQTASYTIKLKILVFKIFTVKCHIRVKLVGTAGIILDFYFPFFRMFVHQTPIQLQPLKHRLYQRIYTHFMLPLLLTNKLTTLLTNNILNDVVVLQNKKYMKNSVLAEEDANIINFRRWFSQFYSKRNIGQI